VTTNSTDLSKQNKKFTKTTQSCIEQDSSTKSLRRRDCHFAIRSLTHSYFTMPITARDSTKIKINDSLRRPHPDSNRSLLRGRRDYHFAIRSFCAGLTYDSGRGGCKKIFISLAFLVGSEAHLAKITRAPTAQTTHS
jgi:hypothetical protein